MTNLGSAGERVAQARAALRRYRVQKCYRASSDRGATRYALFGPEGQVGAAGSHAEIKQRREDAIVSELLGAPELTADGFSEFDDVIAYLEQRRDNAAAMAARDPRFCEWARDRRSQLDAMLGELRAGLHHGKAAVRARLLGEVTV